MYLVYTRYIPGVYFRVYVGIYLVYTRYIPGLEITRYIPGIYLVYTSYIADIGLYLVYTRYIPGKFHFSGIQMKNPDATISYTTSCDIKTPDITSDIDSDIGVVTRIMMLRYHSLSQKLRS